MFTLGIAHAHKVKHPDSGVTPDDPGSVVLVGSYRIVKGTKELQGRQRCHKCKVSKCGQLVARQHEHPQVGQAFTHVGGIHGPDAVVSSQQCRQTRKQREISQMLDRVVCEINGIIKIACDAEIFDCVDIVAWWGKGNCCC